MHRYTIHVRCIECKVLSPPVTGIRNDSALKRYFERIGYLRTPHGWWCEKCQQNFVDSAHLLRIRIDDMVPYIDDAFHALQMEKETKQSVSSVNATEIAQIAAMYALIMELRRQAYTHFCDEKSWTTSSLVLYARSIGCYVDEEFSRHELATEIIDNQFPVVQLEISLRTAGVSPTLIPSMPMILSQTKSH